MSGRRKSSLWIHTLFMSPLFGCSIIRQGARSFDGVSQMAFFSTLRQVLSLSLRLSIVTLLPHGFNYTNFTFPLLVRYSGRSCGNIEWWKWFYGTTKQSGILGSTISVQEYI